MPKKQKDVAENHADGAIPWAVSQPTDTRHHRQYLLDLLCNEEEDDPLLFTSGSSAQRRNQCVPNAKPVLPTEETDTTSQGPGELKEFPIPEESDSTEKPQAFAVLRKSLFDDASSPAGIAAIPSSPRRGGPHATPNSPRPTYSSPQDSPHHATNNSPQSLFSPSGDSPSLTNPSPAAPRDTVTTTSHTPHTTPKSPRPPPSPPQDPPRPPSSPPQNSPSVTNPSPVPPPDISAAISPTTNAMHNLPRPPSSPPQISASLLKPPPAPHPCSEPSKIWDMMAPEPTPSPPRCPEPPPWTTCPNAENEQPQEAAQERTGNSPEEPSESQGQEASPSGHPPTPQPRLPLPDSFPDFIPFRTDPKALQSNRNDSYSAFRSTGLRSEPAPTLQERNCDDSKQWDFFRPYLQSTAISIRKAFGAEMGIREGRLEIEHYAPLQACSTIFDRWKVSLFHDMAASRLKEFEVFRPRQIPYELIGTKRFNSEDVIDVLRRTEVPVTRSAPWRCLSRMDCVGRLLQDGRFCVSVCIEDDSYYDSGYLAPTLRVATYEQKVERPRFGEIHSVGSLRQDLLRAESLDVFMNPRTPMTRTLAAVFTNQADVKEDLIKRRERVREFRFLQSRRTDTERRKHERTLEFISRIRDELRLVNKEQAEVMENVVERTASWKGDAEASQLDRFFIVEGVPGCGKTYTLVYTVASLMQRYNPEYLEGLSHTSERRRMTKLHAQTLILTKTNKALDVICERLNCVNLPHGYDARRREIGALPYYCSRSQRYEDERGASAHRVKRSRPIDPSASPILMSTFGNLAKLMRELRRDFDGTSDPMAWWKHLEHILKAVVIDEGSQTCREDLSLFLSLFPAFRGVFIIFGDPRQMGPVVISTVKEVREYLSRSIFEEFSDGREGYIVPCITLNIQYRMNKTIMDLANDVAYNSMMEYGGGNERHDQFPTLIPLSRGSRSTAGTDIPIGPLLVVSTSKTEKFKSTGNLNLEECKIAIAYIDLLSRGRFGVVNQENIAFISVYNEQCLAMEWLCNELDLRIRISTVTTFQGQGDDVILYSLVRSGDASVGISADDKLVTVAITRGRHSLIIIGDLELMGAARGRSTIWDRISTSITCRRTIVTEPEDLLAMDLSQLRAAADIVANCTVPDWVTS